METRRRMKRELESLEPAESGNLLSTPPLREEVL